MKADPATDNINQQVSVKKVKTTPPNIPIGIFIQEALDLYKWCTDDKELLINAGLKWKLVKEIPARAEVLAGLQSDWKSERFNPSEQLKEFKTALPLMLELKKELVRFLRHVLHSNKKGLEQLKNNSKVKGNRELPASMLALTEMGRNHKELLKKSGMDLRLLDDMVQKSNELTILISMVTTGNEKRKNSLKLRNEAFIHLKEAVDEVRRMGQFVFYNNEDRLRGYISHYKKAKNQKHRNSKDIPA